MPPEPLQTRVGDERDTDLLVAQAVMVMLDELRDLGLTEDEIDAAIEEHR